jgi:hypothetical protein
MPTSALSMIVTAYLRTHALALAVAEEAREEQLHWQPQSGRHSLAFHLWHMARWADHLQASLPGMTPELGRRLGSGLEIWTSEKIAQQWGLDTAALGFAQTGMMMGDDVAGQLRFPAKEQLVAYMRQVFAAAERAVQSLDEEQFYAPEQPQPLTEGIWQEGPVGNVILVHLTHDNRHLGMIECLRGLQLGSGTATI